MKRSLQSARGKEEETERERERESVCVCVREKEEVGGQFSWQQEQPKPHVLTHRFDVDDM